MRLEQVFGNLLSNAIKYSPEGGPITVTVGLDHEVALAEVRIRDSGIRHTRRATRRRCYSGSLGPAMCTTTRLPERDSASSSVASWSSGMVATSGSSRAQEGGHDLLPDPASLCSP